MSKAEQKPDLRISDSPEKAASECADYIFASLNEALKSNSEAYIGLSGGSTPRLLFTDMAKKKFDWSKVHIFFVDERCVPPDSKESNFRLAHDTLLGPAAIPESNIHRILGELPPPDAAQKYVAEIRRVFKLKVDELPVFDVLHRGMGPDAHTASLFPGTPLVKDQTGIATNVWVEKMNMDRITLLPGVLMAAKRTVLQVSGAEKADALREVLQLPEDFSKYPCQIASRDDRAVWFLDKAATAKL
jgi:6-phosphogluconolactonase